MFATRFHLRTAVAALLAGAVLAGCGEGDDGMGKDVELPGVPDLMPGMAMLSGRVVDRMGSGIASASLLVAESDATATTGADGRFAMVVRGNSTITLVVTADGFAKTFVESVEVPTGKATTGFDVLVVPAATIDEYAQLAQPGATDRGLVAVMVRSQRDACAMGGARVTFDHPAVLGKVIYAKQGVPMAGDPDPALTGIQVTTGVSAWLAAAVPPGTTYALAIDKAGCVTTPAPVTMGDRIHTGRFRVAAKALTQITLFTE